MNRTVKPILLVQNMLITLTILLLTACRSAPAGNGRSTETAAHIPILSPMSAPTDTPNLIPTQTATQTLMPSPTPTATPTFIPSPTPTPVPVIPVSGIVFHDYSGDGVWDSDLEPPVTGVELIVGNQKVASDANGSFTMLLPFGTHHLYANAPANFRYFTPSIYQEIPIREGIEVSVEEGMVMAVPLVEGPYRSPFHGLDEVHVAVWVDLDTRSCFAGYVGDRECEYILDWLGGKNTYDAHDGTDFWLGTRQVEVYPMRVGIVQEAGPIGDEGYRVLIRDASPYEGIGESYQAYVHLGSLEVSVGQEVTPQTVLGVGGSQAIGGKIHINQYIRVRNEHPANPDTRVIGYNPYVPCPFEQRLWTGIGALARRIIEINTNEPGNRGAFGSQRQIYP